MNVWLLHVGEELPVDPNPRLFRYGRLAEELVNQGHSVLRWAPTFQHFRKSQRFQQDTLISVQENYRIQLVHTPGYRSNISLARLRMHRLLAKRFSDLAAKFDPPDLILTGLPSLEWCESAITYGQQHRVPIVVDIRDLWPDIYANALPDRLRPLGRWAIKPLQHKAGKLFQQADSLVAVSQSYLDWGLRLAGRNTETTDRVFPLGYQQTELSSGQNDTLLTDLEAAGVDRKRTICCFIGLLETSYDVEAVAQAALQLETDAPGQYQIVVAGKGSKEEIVQRIAATTGSLVSLGWIEPEKLAALLSISEVGLAAYASGALQSLPNKAFEYMSAGLAIVSSLSGEFQQLIQQNRLGESYSPSDAVGLAAAIRQVTNRPNQLAGMRERSLALFEQRYTSAQINSDFVDHLQIIHSLSRQPRAAA